MGGFEIQALVAPRGNFFWQSVFWVQEEVSMLEAEQPEDRDREVARRPPLLQCIEVGSPASPGSRNLDAKPKRSCLSTQHGGAVDGGGEGVWGV